MSVNGSKRNGKSKDAVVCLVRPPALFKTFALSTLVTPPLGLAYLAGTLKAHNIKVQVVDAVGENPDQFVPLDFMDGNSIGLTKEQIVERIDKSTDIIGMSCMFSNSWPYDVRLVKLIRERFPNAKIILGGEHVTACADYILETCPEVDVCVKGEGEQTVLELVKTFRNGGDLSAVRGTIYRNGQTIERNVPRERIADVDTVPAPAWDAIPLNNYLDRGLSHGVSTVRSMALLATRGCPYQCTFCSNPQMWGTKWSARDPKLVVDEMEGWIKLYRVENFDLFDLTAIIKKDWLVAFAGELLDRKINITYQLPSGTRSEAIDQEVADLLYRSGCRQMNYAPESGSPATLKRIKKNVNLDNLAKSLHGCCKRGIKVGCNFILFPDDALSDVFETFKFMLRCSWLGLHDAAFVPFVCYPGTELYDKLVKEKRIEPMSEKYFADLLTHSDLSKAVSHNPRFSPKQVQAMRLLFLGTFYLSSYLFRPWRIFTNFKNIIQNTPTTRGENVLMRLVARWKKLSSVA
jgi:anaerobic magnesium-protoporphyrin IX monomethyl ester cyclase